MACKLYLSCLKKKQKENHINTTHIIIKLLEIRNKKISKAAKGGRKDIK